MGAQFDETFGINARDRRALDDLDADLAARRREWWRRVPGTDSDRKDTTSAINFGAGVAGLPAINEPVMGSKWLSTTLSRVGVPDYRPRTPSEEAARAVGRNMATLGAMKLLPYGLIARGIQAGRLRPVSVYEPVGRQMGLEPGPTFSGLAAAGGAVGALDGLSRAYGGK